LAPGDVGAKRTSTVQLSLCASVWLECGNVR
jgi:hypothetical protein